MSCGAYVRGAGVQVGRNVMVYLDDVPSVEVEGGFAPSGRTPPCDANGRPRTGVRWAVYDHCATTRTHSGPPSTGCSS
jgi:hypothetical protein